MNKDDAATLRRIADQIDAVAAARAQSEFNATLIGAAAESAYEQGQRDERARIRAGVKALAWWHLPDGLPKMSRDAVLAVIDAAPQDES